MKQLKQIVAVLICVSFLTMPSFSHAAESDLRVVFENSLYGAAIGVVVGGAIMAFTKIPSDHLDYIGYGAATGVLAGTAFGVAKSARAFAEINNGMVRIAVPAIIPNLIESPGSRQTAVIWHASILRGTFN